MRLTRGLQLLVSLLRLQHFAQPLLLLAYLAVDLLQPVEFVYLCHWGFLGCERRGDCNIKRRLEIGDRRLEIGDLFASGVGLRYGIHFMFLKFGFRFSRKASRPSLASSV